jgi:hypothetical protein
MYHEISRIPRRHFCRCHHDHYHLPALRDRSCVRIAQQDPTRSPATVTLCNRGHLRSQLPLVAIETRCTGLWVLAVDG